jgi:hypothetical protein
MVKQRSADTYNVRGGVLISDDEGPEVIKAYTRAQRVFRERGAEARREEHGTRGLARASGYDKATRIKLSSTIDGWRLRSAAAGASVLRSPWCEHSSVPRKLNGKRDRVLFGVTSRSVGSNAGGGRWRALAAASNERRPFLYIFLSVR